MSGEKYGLMVEFKNQAPILMEGEKQDYRSVTDAGQRIDKNPRVIRWCIVRLEYVAGNEDLCPRPKGPTIKNCKVEIGGLEGLGS